MILDSIRVLDFGRYIAAPFCAALLGDMGAEVIRIERVEGGEDRYVGTVAEDGSGSLFLSVNRNKKGMTLNLAHPTGQEIVRKLVATADIVVANLPLPDMKAIGIDYETLKGLKEDIILVLISAFGTDGPYSHKVGFDTVAQAMSGAMRLTGFEGKPTREVVPFEDYGSGILGAFGAMCALYERQKSGKGQLVDASLMSTSITFTNFLLMEHSLTGILREQAGNKGYFAAPVDAYQTKNGWIVVSVVGDPMFRRWTKVVGHPELVQHPELQNDSLRNQNASLLDEIMIPWCQQRSTEQALMELEQARIPCGPVYDIPQVLSDPHLQARHLLTPISYPACSKYIPMADTPVRLSATPGSIRLPPPTLGEHTHLILQSLGYTEQEIENWYKLQII